MRIAVVVAAAAAAVVAVVGVGGSGYGIVSSCDVFWGMEERGFDVLKMGQQCYDRNDEGRCPLRIYIIVMIMGWDIGPTNCREISRFSSNRVSCK